MTVTSTRTIRVIYNQIKFSIIKFIDKYDGRIFIINPNQINEISLDFSEQKNGEFIQKY